MYVLTEKTEKVIVDEIDNIKCDVCGRNLLKGREWDDVISVATLRLSTSTPDQVKQRGLKDPDECESSDLCEKCYKKVLRFVRETLKGKVPSYYYSEEQEEKELPGDSTS